MNRLSIAIGLALCVALSATAQTYKWVDANGKVQYSDKPPRDNVKTETLREPARAPSAPAASADKGDTPKAAAKSGPKTAAEQEQAFRKRQAEASKAQEEQTQKETDARDRAENCKRAKAALASLELGGRQTRIDDKGERVFLTDKEIALATSQAKQEAAGACN